MLIAGMVAVGTVATTAAVVGGEMAPGMAMAIGKIPKVGAIAVIVTIHIITDAGVQMRNGTLAMTDAQRVLILLKAIRCILATDWREDWLRTQLIKSVLIEAVKECGEECEEMLK